MVMIVLVDLVGSSLGKSQGDKVVYKLFSVGLQDSLLSGHLVRYADVP